VPIAGWNFEMKTTPVVARPVGLRRAAPAVPPPSRRSSPALRTPLQLGRTFTAGGQTYLPLSCSERPTYAGPLARVYRLQTACAECRSVFAFNAGEDRILSAHLPRICRRHGRTTHKADRAYDGASSAREKAHIWVDR
jgi:hypothetical protein